MAARSYVKPSAVDTGSTISSVVIGHTKPSGIIAAEREDGRRRRFRTLFSSSSFGHLRSRSTGPGASGL
eukprot:1025605-Prymnesium_polylepis.1